MLVGLTKANFLPGGTCRLMPLSTCTSLRDGYANLRGQQNERQEAGQRVWKVASSPYVLKLHLSALGASLGPLCPRRWHVRHSVQQLENPLTRPHCLHDNARGWAWEGRESPPQLRCWV